MSNKSFNQEDNQPFDYHKAVDAAKKQEKPNADNLIMALRSEMLPASSASPARRNIFQRLNIKIIGGLLVGLVILGLIWFSLIGPGRVILENKLASLISLKVTATERLDPSPLPSTNTPSKPSSTPFSSPTAKPTNTPTIKIVAAASQLLAITTPIPTPACRDVLTITLADVGQTLCVQGTVVQIIDKPNNFMLVFSYERGAFYWVSYDMVWSKAEVDTCYQVQGIIRQIGNNPILVFNYTNIPETCP